MFGNGDFERGRKEAMEGRERIERRDRIEAESAAAVRNRLEKASPDCARRNFAGILNSLVADAASQERPGLDAYNEIRQAHRLGRRTAADHNRAHDAFEKAAGSDFNRLHPGSSLRRDDIASGREARERYDPSGDVGDISPEFLLAVAKELLAMARRRAADAPKDRRDGGR